MNSTKLIPRGHAACREVPCAENNRRRLGGTPTADLLPHELAPGIATMIEQGLAVMKRTMEAPVAGPAASAADFR